MRPPSPQRQQQLVNEFNAAYPVGQRVSVRLDNGESKITTTSSGAVLMGGHTAVIWVEGISGCYALDRVSPVAAEEPQPA